MHTSFGQDPVILPDIGQAAEAETRYRILFEGVRHGILFQDAEGMVLAANAAAQRILGVAAEQMRNQSAEAAGLVLLREDGSVFPAAERPAMTALRTGLPVEDVLMAIQGPRSEGTRWLLVTSLPLFQPGQAKPWQVMSTFEDITERKAAVDALRESEFFFKESQRAAAIGSYKTDFLTGRWESSAVLDSIFGIDGAYDRSLQGWMEIVHPGDRETMGRYVSEEVIGKRQPFRKDYRILRPLDGETRWVHGLGEVAVDGEGRVRSLTGTIQDITDRKRAEQELRDGQARQERAESVARFGYWELDLARQKIHGSKGAQAIYGLEGDEWSLPAVQSLRLPEDKALAEAALTGLIRLGQPYNIEFRIRRHNDGEVRYLHSIAEYDPARGFLFGVINDITERKRAEEALRTSEQFYRDLLERQGEGFAVVDAGETFILANPVAEEIFGVAQGTLPGRSLFEFVDADQRPMIIAQTRRRMDGERATYPIRIHRPDGEARTIQATVVPRMATPQEPFAVIAVFRDITELTRAQKDLRRSEERYRTLFDHVPDGILLVDAENEGTFGRIVDANEAAAAQLGYTLEELKGLDIEALSDPSQNPRQESFEARIWRQKPGETVQEELLHRRKDGSTLPVEAIGTLVHLHGQQFILAFCRDITERKRGEQALLMTQRTESIGVLAGGIAHDFNNLLTAIMGQTNLAMERMGPASRSGDHLTKALNAAEKAALLTRQMLAYSGRGQFTIQSVSLNRVILENLKFLESAIPKKVKFIMDLEDGLPRVTADSGQLQQVVMNLVLNGAEAIGDAPGSITIRTRALSLESIEPSHWPLGSANLAPGVYVVMEVADTGCGMSGEVASRVFDPFFTTKPKGHGLGLSAVQGIIRGHRGGLRVDSKVGRGTTFRVLLPAEDECPLPAPPKASPLENGQGRRVLVVDDEDFMLEVVHDSLEAGGHTCFLAQSGEEGLELAERLLGELDLVLLDLSMPGLGGVETFKRLQALDPDLPVVLTSGYAEEEARAQLGQLKLAAFLQKPYLAKDLARVVEGVAPRVGR